MAKTFHCSLVTPEASILEAEAVYAELPVHDGQLGVMIDRAPLLVKLGVGKLRLDLADQAQQWYFVDGGFAQMRGNHLTLLTERAVPADQISSEDAIAAAEQARAIVADTDEHFEQRQHDLAVAEQMRSLCDRAGPSGRRA